MNTYTVGGSASFPPIIRDTIPQSYIIAMDVERLAVDSPINQDPMVSIPEA